MTPPGRVFTVSVAACLGWCALAPLSHALPKSVFGELPDLLMMTAFLWPYPLLLALQRILPPDSWTAFLAADLAGLALVGWFARFVDRRWGAAWTRSRSTLVGLFSWPLPLVAVELLAWGAALALGWPVGV